jgi:hypothetical protein
MMDEHVCDASLPGSSDAQRSPGVPPCSISRTDTTHDLFEYNGKDLRNMTSTDAKVVCESRAREGLKDIPVDGKHPDL